MDNFEENKKQDDMQETNLQVENLQDDTAQAENLQDNEVQDAASQEDNTSLEKEKKKERKKHIIEWTVYAIVLVALYISFHFIWMIGKIPSESMEPTLMIHDWTIGSRTIYKDEMPERGDIVIFYSDEEQETMVKRVIGLPGETITFVGGHVYVDGERLDESAYLEDSVVTEPGEQDKFVVPDGCIFVLGDNREVSYDARYWENPYISQDKIQSDVEVVIPFHKLPWF